MSEKNDLIHGLVDGELSSAERRQAMELIQNDSEARIEYEWASALKSCVQCKCGAQANPEGLSRALEQVRAIEKTKSAEVFVGRWAWALCAAVVCFICLAAVVNRISGGTELQQTNVASLFSGLRVLSGAEQNTAETVRQTFGSVPIRPDLIAVRQVAYGVVDGRRALRIRAEDREGQLVLVVIQGVSTVQGMSPIAGSDYSSGVIQGATSVFWSQDGLGFLVLGARDGRSLIGAAETLRGRQP